MLKTWLIFSLLFLFLIPVVLFSQEQPSFSTYKPQDATSKGLVFEKKLKHEEQKFKSSGDFQRLLIYLVTREDDLSLCKGGKECLELAAEDLLPMRYLSEGRCDEIKYEVWGEKEICKALKENSCDELSDWKGDFCRGLMDENLSLLLRAGSTKGFKGQTGYKLSSDQAAGILAFYAGYRHYSALPCERFMKDEPLLPEQLSCEILFSPFGGVAFNDIVRDIALFNISKDEKDTDLCNLIKYQKVKRHCQDRKVKKLNDIW